MRLIAVPLARVRPGAQPVATFLAQQTKLAAAATTTKPAAEPPLSTRLLNKASNFWLSLGRDGEDGKGVAVFDWKRRTYTFGEKLMDRIEYEEWALKAVDPSLDPSYTTKAKPSPATDPTSSSSAPSPSPQDVPTIRMHYPPSLISPAHLMTNLTSLASTRAPHHRSRMIWCVIGMPFTIPFAIVPIVPNLPFFYLVWRAWSHLQAYRSSTYLTHLLDTGRIVPFSDASIDAVFKDHDPSQQLILTKANIEALKTTLDLNQQCCNELIRARQQTKASIEQGKLEKLERAAEGLPKDKDDAETDKKQQ